MATSTPVGDTTTFLGGSPGAERIYDNVQASLPGGAPLPLVQMQLWNAISDFALRSTWYRTELNWAMSPSQALYDFNPYDANMTVCWVLAQRGLTCWKVSVPSTLVDLQSDVSQPRTGTALVALKPARLDANLPADLFDQWFEAMLSGTLGRLYALPAKPWSDGKAALVHMRSYSSKIGEARDIARRRYSDNPTWCFPYFARGRRV